MPEFNILELYKQDLDEMYQRYAKIYTICTVSIVINVIFAVVYMILFASKLP